MSNKSIKNSASQSFNSWCDIGGNQRKLATACGVTSQAINQWRKQVPAERLPIVVRITGIRESDLRPDIYDEREAAA
jgi:DNA-binding transcriptional regulator YdaS (Cro superfamily)